METVVLRNEESMKSVAERVAGEMESTSVVGVIGGVGSGKTIFAKMLVNALGLKTVIVTECPAEYDGIENAYCLSPEELQTDGLNADVVVMDEVVSDDDFAILRSLIASPCVTKVVFVRHASSVDVVRSVLEPDRAGHGEDYLYCLMR